MSGKTIKSLICGNQAFIGEPLGSDGSKGLLGSKTLSLLLVSTNNGVVVEVSE